MPIISKSQLRNHSESMSKARRDFSETVRKSSAQSTVFLSHKHSDKTEVKQMYNLLKSLGANVYIDWLDPDMPETTRGETAVKIKDKINLNDKFILLATEDAIASKWCNWELGYGDAHKHKNNKIALFPLKEDNSSWEGSEYMEIYHIIEYYNGTTTYTNGERIEEGYYVCEPKQLGKARTIQPLRRWLEY